MTARSRDRPLEPLAEDGPPEPRAEELAQQEEEPRCIRCVRSPVTPLLAAIGVGAALGVLLLRTGLGRSDFATLLAFPGRLWLKALKCIVLPMIVFSMIKAMVILRSLPGAKLVGVMVVGLYLTTTVVAAVEGSLAAAAILHPAAHALPHEAAGAEVRVMERTLLETVVAMVDNLMPKNLLGDAAKDNLLPVIVASIVFGLLVEIEQADGTESVTLRLINELDRVVVKVVTFIMSLTPIGVGSLVFKSAASLNLAEVGGSVGFLMAAVVSGLLIHSLAFYPFLLAVIARRNPATYFMNLLPALATALGTSSSAATLPVSVKCAVEKNGISEHVANFVLSLGATINMDGTTIYLICATCFLAALHGVEFGAAEYLLTILLATLCSMGSAPVPSAALVLLATILTSVGVPLDETFGLITAVDWMLDRLRTVVNVAGDAVIAAVVEAHGGPCAKARAEPSDV